MQIGAMHALSATLTSCLVAMPLLTLSVSARASDDCSVADALIDRWISSARGYSSVLPTTTAAQRKDLEFKTRDQIVLKGYSYAPAISENESAAKQFIVLLQGSASSAAQLAETASSLALAAKREVFVYEYRGYAHGSTVRPTAASIQEDVDDIIERLSQGNRHGVVIGLSLGGIFAIQSLKHSKSSQLRVLVDSVPAKVPWIPFMLNCPQWMNPLDAATTDVVQRLGVLYSRDDGWSKDSAASEFMEKVKAGGGRVWLTKGRHVDLSPSGLAIRLPIYVAFVRERTP